MSDQLFNLMHLNNYIHSYSVLASKACDVMELNFP